MKRYLRLLCLLMSSVLLSLTLAACGGGVTEAPTEGTIPATNPPEETTPLWTSQSPTCPHSRRVS